MEFLRNRSVSLALATVVGGVVLAETTACTTSPPKKKPAAIHSTTASPTPGSPKASPSATAEPAPSPLLVGQTCQPIQAQKWLNPTSEFPPDFPYDIKARALGVSPESMRNGLFGSALCRQAVSRNDIGARTRNTIVAVPGIGEHCLVVAIDAQGLQEQPPNHIGFKRVGVLCPAVTTVTV